jgi:hypothetical protein
MVLKKKLDSIDRTELTYFVAGVLLLALTALGLQYQKPTPQDTGNQLTVNLQLDKPDSNVSNKVDLKANSTVFDAVNASFEIDYTEYEFGYFLTSIDGLTQNQTHSWVYYVDGEAATKAVNNYYLSDGDNITFEYTSENIFE